MAFRVDARLIRDATTVNLSGWPTMPSASPSASACALLGWTPSRADLVTGLPEQLAEAEPVEERLRIAVIGTSYAVLTPTILEIERLLAEAELYRERRVGSPVYLEVRSDTTGSWYRTPVLGGRVAYDELAFKAGGIGGVVDIELTIQRMYYWELSAAQTLSLTNRNGTSTNLTTWNYALPATSGRDDWVTIAAGAVAGNLPTPPILRLTDQTASGTLTSLVYVNHSHVTAGLTGSVLQGSDSTAGSNAGSAAASNGTFRTATIASSVSDTVAFSWSLSSAFLANYAGVPVDVLAVFDHASPPPATVSVKAQITFNNTAIVLWDSGWVTGNGVTAMLEFGATRMPPYLAGGANLGTLTFQIVARLTPLASNVTLRLDQVRLFPRVWFRRYRPGAGVVPSGYALYDQPADQLLFTGDTSGNNRRAFYVGSGQIYLMPAVEQRLWFAHTVDAFLGAFIFRQTQVQIQYRPRYASIWG